MLKKWIFLSQRSSLSTFLLETTKNKNKKRKKKKIQTFDLNCKSIKMLNPNLLLKLDPYLTNQIKVMKLYIM